MRFNPALVSSFLFASAFLVGRHCEQSKSWLINRVEQSNGVMSEDIYAGSTLKADHVCINLMDGVLFYLILFSPTRETMNPSLLLSMPLFSLVQILPLPLLGS